MTFKIIKKSTLKPYRQPKLNRRVETTEFEIEHDLPVRIDVAEEHVNVTKMYEQMLEPFLNEISDKDLISVTVQHERLHNVHGENKPLYIGYVTKDRFDPEQLLNQLERVTQSNNFLEDKLIRMTVAIIENGNQYPEFGAKQSFQNKPPTCFDTLYKKMKTLYEIRPNNDTSCVYWALALGLEYHLHRNQTNTSFVNKNDFDNIRLNRVKKGNGSLGFLEEKARELCFRANVDYNQVCNLKTLEKLQNYLEDFGIQIFLFVRPQRFTNEPYKPMFKGADGHRMVGLDAVDNHVNLFVSLEAYFNTRHFCRVCFKRCKNLYRHFCRGRCLLCRSPSKCEGKDKIPCRNCNREFHGPKCYFNHIDNGICTNQTRCEECDEVYDRCIPHRCFEPFCRKCNESYLDFPHHCYIKPIFLWNLQKKDQEEHRVIITFDIETRQDEINGKGYHIHIPTLLIASINCSLCYDDVKLCRKIDDCSVCGPSTKYFDGDNCIKDFGDWLYDQFSKNNPLTKIFAIAHNFGRFDGRFILQDIWKRSYINCEMILNANQIMKIDLGNIRFIDSYLIFQMPLSALPSAFGLEGEKGYFPYLFDTRANKINGDEDIELPSKEFYNVKYMKEEDLSKFLKWYDGEKSRGTTFNLNRDRKIYCEQDVKILTQAVFTFRRIFKEINQYDFISNKFTLASLAFEVFKTTLTKKTIGITPIGGYKQRKGSIIATAWLDLQEFIRNIQIKREFKLSKYYADGYHPETKTVFEFNGCFFHGCFKCRPDNERYAKTMEKKKYYLDHGFNLIDIWEHECEDGLTKEQRDYFRKRINQHRRIERTNLFNLRGAFFGGRTSFTKLYYDCSQGEKIRYIDFLSLYPTVLFKFNYPVGHPKTISHFNKPYDISPYKGFISCDILPPKDLRIPVLPVRTNGKLMFPLCLKCAETIQQNSCTHQDNERSLRGIWTTAEVNKAIESGYEIQYIYQVFHYENMSNDIFREYIIKWIKLKQEKSGWPHWCIDDTTRKEFLDSWKELGVILDPKSIELNKGLRTIAKMFLNTCWGKLAEKLNKPMTHLCRTVEEILTIANDPQLEILGEIAVGDESLQITFKHKDDETSRVGDTSVAVAAYVTSYARLMLLEAIEKIERQGGEGRVLYYDTDSIVFVEKDGENLHPCGNILGQLTDEILSLTNDPHAYIKTAVFAAPKSYGLQIVNKEGKKIKTILKTRGITRHAAAASFFTFDTYRTLVDDAVSGVHSSVNVPQSTIRSDKRQNMFTVENTKRIRVVSDKRVIIKETYDTLPYGHRDIE